jgi:signal transduction histidine kinase
LRQLERDIKGGTQQQLLAISARIRGAADLMERDPVTAGAMLDELGVEANDALETLRDLARGIFPPLLADKGLVAALDAHINKTKIPAMLRTDGSIGRYNSSVEAAVYFCCIEAMQNASKYAEGSPILATLEANDSSLSFEVSDEGPGFDPNDIHHRSGLQQMADRVEALEGTLEVTSKRNGGGTQVTGRIPVWAKEPAR